MDEEPALVRAFHQQRSDLRARAARMLGSLADADDAVQEMWLRVAREPDPAAVRNPAGWLRTVLSRICLDALRARRARREDPAPDVGASDAARDADPAGDAVLADAVGRALLAVLDTLDPAERVAFVLHDMFAVPHGEIATVLDRTPAATKKLASRARLRVRGGATSSTRELAERRDVVARFLAATRAGDLDAVLAVLAPDVVRRADATALPPGAPPVLRGARAVAGGTVLLAARSAQADLALVAGSPGLVVTAGGRLRFAVTFTVEDGLVTGYDVLADPDRLAGVEVALMP